MANSVVNFTTTLVNSSISGEDQLFSARITSKGTKIANVTVVAAA